ncbi:purine-binding chemotaxis protein CheW [Rhizomicrobium palustre]|uniref:Purine-binding chemotaxis protein CheW n=1 Tax=Rhizomicrobium palustre TaxID=189966 RepID=A0A846MZP4_9PROT|nr:chemotaxis protein CheW [Rhizomicrobium palustre]NIK89088.1 purine-binding chemotaxis protein CheW [Rhizomicrobium palustre]
MSSADGQYVTLGLGAEVFAVPVAMVQEILDYRTPFAIPEGPAFMLGLIDVRGRGMPLIDLRLKLGLPRQEPTPVSRILVLEVPLKERTLSLALLADRVLEVVSFPATAIEGAPDVGIAWRSDYIAGVVHRAEGFVVLFDVAQLLTSSDLALLQTAA